MTNEEFIESIRLPGEKWRDVDDYKGYYMVSSLGRILSRQREVPCKGGVRVTKPFLKSFQILKRRKLMYYTVHLSKDGKKERKTVHRIVAFAFLPNPNGYPEIDHINRNGLDNRVDNLRWCTRKMNMANENTRKIITVCHKGADRSYRWRPVVQLKDGVVVRSYQSMAEAARVGYRQNNIVQVCRGEKKSHRGYQWMYLEDYEKSISSSNCPALSCGTD